MKTKSLNAVSMILVAVMLTLSTLVQAQAKLNPAKSSVVINGTSTLHDWSSKVTPVNGDIVVADKEVKSLVIRIPVTSIKSVKNESKMDKYTYEVFNDKKNPLITFTLTEPAPIVLKGTVAEVTLTGNLSMGGATRKISFKSTGTVQGSTYHMTGTVPVKLTDYKMTPPSLMLGTIKVGDALTLKIDVTVDNVQ